MLLRDFHLLFLYLPSTNPLLKFYYLEQMGYSAKDYGARDLLLVFPRWEQSVPKVGTKYSQAGNIFFDGFEPQT